MSELFAPDLHTVPTGRGTRGSLYERFIAKLDREDANGCLLWGGGADPVSGRGRIGFGGKTYIAPRVAYVIAFGPFDASKSVLHSCDNAACVQPAHLRLGTQAENIGDMVNRGRCRNQHTGAQAPLQESR